MPAEGVLCRVTHGPHTVSLSLAQLFAILLIAVVGGFLALQGACGMVFISDGFRYESNKVQLPGGGLALIGVTCVCGVVT